MRVLYLHGTFVPPPQDRRNDRFSWLSTDLEGDVLQEVWSRRPEDVERAFGPGSYPVYTVGGFRYHFLLGSARRSLFSRLSLAWFFLSVGLRLHRKRGFDCIITYSHTLTGLCGVLLKLLTGAKLIVEIVIAPDTAYRTELANSSFLRRVMQLYSDFCLHICLWSCDRVHLLAPSLIAGYKRLRNVPSAVFFEGVPVAQVPQHIESDERYILLVGAPWHRKGVDLLVKAFLRLAPDFPSIKLKLLGHYSDLGSLEGLIQSSMQIEILKARPNKEALEIISKAMIFALPSRCEGVPRVVLEAMAAGVPVVASDVDGIPSLIQNGENGFLVPVDDIDELEARLRQLLSDPELRAGMGAKGYQLAHTKFSESAYVSHFTRMVESTVNGSMPVPPLEGTIQDN